MADVLVLGGNGFLGSSLVDELVGAGHRVTAFDRFSRPPVFTAEGVRVLRGDLADRAAVADALAGHEVVFHFGGATTPASSVRDPGAEVRREVESTVDMLESAVAAGTRRVVFASTGGAIYGDKGSAAISEEIAAAPKSPYGIGKLAVEGFLRYFGEADGLDTVSLRISNPYGPRQRPDRDQGLIPIVLRRMARGEPVVVFGDGTMVRDYVYAPDVARQVAKLADADHRHGVYNVGSGVGHTVGEREHRDAPPGFVHHSLLDVSRFDGEFGRTSRVGLDEGVALTWRAIAGES